MKAKITLLVIVLILVSSASYGAEYKNLLVFGDKAYPIEHIELVSGDNVLSQVCIKIRSIYTVKCHMASYEDTLKKIEDYYNMKGRK